MQIICIFYLFLYELIKLIEIHINMYNISKVRLNQVQ